MNKTVRVLAVGDVVSAVGCEKLRELLPSLKKEKNIDISVEYYEDNFFEISNKLIENIDTELYNKDFSK